MQLRTHISLRMKLDEELLPLEAQLADLGPREAVDLGEVLKDEDAHVGHSQIQRNSVVVLKSGESLSGGETFALFLSHLGRVHFGAVELAPPGGLQQIEIAFRRRLSPASVNLCWK